MNNENLDIRVSITEMQLLLSQINGSIEVCKSTSRSILSSASLIIALVGALQIFSSKINSNYLTCFRIGIGVTAILYIALIVCCIIVLNPARISSPIAPSWDVLQEAFSDKTERELLKTQLSAYLNSIKKNEIVVNRSAHLTTTANILLPIIVLFLFLLALIPKD
jgi:hypothetical protein